MEGGCGRWKGRRDGVKWVIYIGEVGVDGERDFRVFVEGSQEAGVFHGIYVYPPSQPHPATRSNDFVFVCSF